MSSDLLHDADTMHDTHEKDAEVDYHASIAQDRTPAEVHTIALIRIARVLEVWEALGFPAQQN